MYSKLNVAGIPHVRSALNPLHAELNPIYHLLALLGAHHILHVSRIRVNFFTNAKLLTSYNLQNWQSS